MLEPRVAPSEKEVRVDILAQASLPVASAPLASRAQFLSRGCVFGCACYGRCGRPHWFIGLIEAL